MKILQKIVGIIYVLAGLGKAFPQLENVSEVLHNALLANQNTILEGVSEWLYLNSAFINIFVGIALFSSGLVLLINKSLVKAAIIGQILMLICFITILHKAYWQIFIIDGVLFFIALILLLNQLTPSFKDKKQRNLQTL
ncbi:DUF6041 domain-containing protein [Spartinivicinus ruber]|uniref:DUF6041 domain-containing protein n=1 Tax=Spartinivicinus ruber TaxID=2683272 RepID=UPI0013D105C1|nr:DUF6041 domain-containing protein [Spartinivicinus ruber]